MPIDAHFHLLQSYNSQKTQAFSQIRGCTCTHEKIEFLETEDLIQRLSLNVQQAFGLHPQNPSIKDMDFLDSLLRQKRICAVGETGFDFFTPELKQNEEVQIKAFEFCLEEAEKYNVPLIIHNRKALDYMYRYNSQLKKIRAVLFHSFPFGLTEAKSLLNHGINAYFSFGKPLLNGSKKAIECVKGLNIDCFLLETDAPYQTLKGEKFTYCSDIDLVYNEVCRIRNMEKDLLIEETCKNYNSFFNL